jgi:hypothetical protein
VTRPRPVSGDAPTRPDAAGRLLAVATRLMPAGRRDWGRAMCAELAAIDPRPARWRFALGATRVAVTQRVVLRFGAHVALTVIALAAAVARTRDVPYPALRHGLVALVAVLLAVSWLARLPWTFGPAAPGRAARIARAGGYLLVAGFAAVVLDDLRGATHGADEKAHVGIPIYTTVLALYAIGFVAATAAGHQPAARRAPAESRSGLAVATAAGAAGGLLWLAPVLIRPPLPATSAWALLVVVGVVCAVAAGDRGRRAVPTLYAGAVACLLIVVLANGLLNYFPHWVPDIGGPHFPATLTAAQRLASNRGYAQDPYILVLFLGCLLAVALAVATVPARWRRSRVS